ncbi:MAG: invasion associated locus B family protein [Neomegalonema sp.]|nr:invasion associated locus B family protein [Neomegalonema sp.]
MKSGFAKTIAARLAKAAAATATVITLSLIGTGGMAQAQDALGSNDPVRESHGAWEVRCTEGSGKCYIQQIWNNAEGTPAVAIRISKLATPISSGNATIVAMGSVITPLGVFLPNGLGLKVDSDTPQVAPFVRCFRLGCVAEPPISDTLIEKFKAGSTATFLVRGNTSEPPIEAPLSLSGFTAAFDAL